MIVISGQKYTDSRNILCGATLFQWFVCVCGVEF
jgi:hypothetical protein